MQLPFMNKCKVLYLGGIDPAVLGKQNSNLHYNLPPGCVCFSESVSPSCALGDPTSENRDNYI